MNCKIKTSKITFSRKCLINFPVFLVFIFVLFNANFNFNISSLDCSSVCKTDSMSFIRHAYAQTAPTLLERGADFLGSIVKGGVEIAASPLLWVFNALLFAVFTVVSLLFFFAGMLFDWAVNPANFTLVVGSEAVYYGWTLIRDFLNLAFIIVLLFSAFCTIFQVEKYHLKKILLILVIMALLVNFSFPIARFIIDSANVLMYFVLGKAFPHLSNSSGLSANIVETFNITKLTVPDFNAKEIIFPTTFTIKAILAIIFMFIATITLLVIGALLVIRIVVLAILIIFSPIGFVGAIFPSTKGYADSWWTHLFKQSFFGPIMIFMLYLAIAMMTAMNKDQQLMNSVNGLINNNSNLSNYSGIIVAGTYLAIPIVILWVGLIAAQKMGAAGANAIVSKAGNIAKWPGRMAGKGIKYGAVSGLKKFDRDVLASRGLSPRAFVEGWKQRAAEVEEKVMKPAAGGWHDRINKILGKEVTHYEGAALQANILKKQKELTDVNTDSKYLFDEYKSAKAKGDNQKMAAILRILFNNNDQNDFMNYNNKSTDPYEMRDFIYNELKSGDMDDEVAAKQLSDLSEIAVTKGNYANYGMADFVDGKFVKQDDNAKQASSVAAKFSNIKAQTRADLWHWNSILVQNSDGSAGELHEPGQTLLKSITKNDQEVLNRVRKDFLDKLSEKESKIRDFANDRSQVDEAQGRVINSFMDRLIELKRGEKK